MKALSLKIFKFSVYATIFIFSFLGYYLLAKKLGPKPDPISFAQNMLCTPDGCIKRVLFPPEDDVKTVLIGLIQAEQRHICVAIFMFTEPDLAKALLEAHERGVNVEIVADRSCAQTQWSKLQPLAQAGIPIYIWPQALEASRAIMHNKFVIFAATINNRALIWTGSYNFTKAASYANQENALVLDDKELILKYYEQFEHLKQCSESVGVSKLPKPCKRKKHGCKPEELGFVQL